MTRRLAHRGPDDRATLVDGPAGLAHTRLSIIDVEGGHQPISNEDGSIWLVFNGEIYNHADLRQELIARGHAFKTRSDTEVNVHLYEDFGERCVERLNGIFAFAIWDSRRQILLLARDPFGVKPMYYARSASGLLFGSELKALLCDESLSREVDPTALEWFLTYGYVPSPRTLLSAVKKLEPGHVLVARSDGIATSRYATPSQVRGAGMSEREAVELVQHEFERAVERQMMSDVPIGAFLSGGVDSGALVGVMAEHSDRVRTYTVGFAEGGDADELAEARATAALFATDHADLVVTADECAAALPEVVWHLDEPLSTTSALPLYFLAGLASRDVKVALAGQGADEPLAGYTRYLGERYRNVWRSVPAPVRGLIRSAVEQLPRLEPLKRGVRSLAVDDEPERFRRIHALLPSHVIGQLLRPETRTRCEEDATTPMRRWLRDLPSTASSVSRLQYVDMRTDLSDNLLQYGDRMSMAHGIEMRVPFLDLQFVSALERVPTHLLIHGLEGKYVWKKAARRWLPRDIVQRRKKGFATPVDAWFRGALNGQVRETLLSPSARLAEHLDQRSVAALLDDHRRGRHNYYRTLFALLSFETWLEQFVGGQVPARAGSDGALAVAHS